MKMTAEDFCKANELSDDITFVICAAFEYEKNKHNTPWLKNAERSKYGSEALRVLDNLIQDIKDKGDDINIESKNETVPKHYLMPIEPITFIMENDLSFLTGCIVKYGCRVGKKDTKTSNLRKMRFYLDCLVNKSYQETAFIYGREK